MRQITLIRAGIFKIPSYVTNGLLFTKMNLGRALFYIQLNIRIIILEFTLSCI